MRRPLTALVRIARGFRDLPASTPIGVGLASTSERALLALITALLVTAYAMKLTFVGWEGPSLLAFYLEQLEVAIAAALVLALLARGRPGPLGLGLPRHGLGTWLRYTALAGLAIAVAGVPVGVALWLGGAFDGGPPETLALTADAIGEQAFWSLVYAPLFEELLFRVVLCSALVAVLGRWPGILISALVFGLWHYHVPGPTNLIAGVAFGWAYVVSGSVVVPITWHLLGNLFVLLADVAYAAWIG